MLWIDFINTQTADSDYLESWPDLSPRILEEARALRSALRKQAASIVDGDRTLAATAPINRVLKAAPGYPQLVKGEIRHVTTLEDPIGVLSDVAYSAAEFLVSGDYARLKRCEGKNCVLFFYDTTKNHSRRFCSAEGCGNRYKAAARYERLKRERAASSEEN